MRRTWVFLLFSLLVATLSWGEEVRIKLLHVNDFHGFAQAYKPVGSQELLGGAAALSAAIEASRQEVPSLLLAAGDMWQGGNWANLFQGESCVALMNAMGFDAMVLGNHEFDAGQAVLQKRLEEAKFPVLAANLKGLDGVTPYIIKTLQNTRIGIIGVVTEDAPMSTDPRNVQGLEFLPVKETVEKLVEELKPLCDVIVVLSHCGHSRERTLAEEVEGVDVVVGGHSHTKVEKPPRLGRTLVVQAWEHAKALGVVDITLQEGEIRSCEGHLEMIKPQEGVGNPEVLRIVQSYQSRLDSLLNETIGEALVDLDGVNVRHQETNLGNFMADIMRQASNAQACIINGGGLRTSILQGPIQMKDVYAVLPFDNYVVAIRLTGKQIREVLEYSVSAVEDLEGRFPQVSGITFGYCPTAPKGARVGDIQINGTPLHFKESYVIATNDFLAAGGDGYKAFGEAIKSSPDYEVIGGAMKGSNVVYSDAGRWLRDRVAEYIKSHPQVSPQVEGRIKEISP